MSSILSTNSDNNRLYKAGVYLELQRFQDKKNRRGLDLSFAQFRALSALTILLAETKYKGNQKEHKIINPNWIYLKASPVLSFTWQDYLDMYYGKRVDNGNHRGQQVQIAKSALIDLLDKSLKIAYQRKIFIEQEIKLFRRYTKRNQNDNGKNKITLAYHPVFIDYIESFFTLKPLNLYSNIKDFLNCRQVKRAVLLFIELLLTYDDALIETDISTIIERLWLDKVRDYRNKSRVEETLNQCFEVAHGLGYLSNQVRQEKSGKLILELNEEKCTRIRVKQRNATDNEMSEEGLRPKPLDSPEGSSLGGIDQDFSEDIPF